MSRISDSLQTGLHDWILRERFDAIRRRVVSDATGRVLEIGAGTGLNFGFYSPTTDVVAIEPGRALRELASTRARDPGVRARVEVIDARAERLPFDAGSFDAAVITFTLCSIEQLNEALAEIHRVLRPGGTIHLAEHVLSPDANTARWQRRVQPVWTHVFGGCSLTRDLPPDLERAGFDASDLTSTELPLPGIARAGLVGRVVRD